jgi:G3E family GTPase
MCCDLSDTVEESLIHLLRKVRGAPVFVETTGLASTSKVVDGIKTAMLDIKSELDSARRMSSIAVVDTPRFEAFVHTWSEGIGHLRHVDNVILNKLDQASRSQTDWVEKQVRMVNPRACVLRAVV